MPERDVEGGIVEVYEAQLPLLIAPHQNRMTPRFPSLPGIMELKETHCRKKATELITDKVRVEVQLQTATR